MPARFSHRPIIWLAPVLVLALGLILVIARSPPPARGSGPPPPLLPNLVADSPNNVSMETSTTDGGLSEAGEAKLLLRFNGYVHNDGEGALDFRGEREAPKVGSEAQVEVVRREKELREAKEEQEKGGEPKEPQPFSEQTEHELATPVMKVLQRLFATNSGVPTSNPEESKEAFEKFSKENEAYLGREPHKDEPSSAEMFYVNADGHHHWHLQHVAKYSLWNASQTVEVAPAEKVGFCLEDSEHIEYKKGNQPTPEAPVYSDDVAPYRDFCQRYLPNATSVYEGISPGWRDKYGSELGFQWVDISDVLPGEYWLREEVNPDKVIKEEGVGSKVDYAEKPTIVPGFDALPEAVHTGIDQSVTINATSKAWDDTNQPNYQIVSPPQHGSLQPISGTDQAVYTPDEGYSGPDAYTFSASDPNSEFPRNPAVAAVSIEVGAVQAPTVAISGAPSAMIAGTSVQLTAAVTGDSPEVTWSASAGSITSGGLYTAPSTAGGTAEVTARSSKGAAAGVAIAIQSTPAAVSIPAAGAAPSSGVATPQPAVYRPTATLIGRKLIMTTKASKAGRIRLGAYLGHRLLGTCAAKTLANRSFTCRLTLGKRIRLNSRITVVASLRVGSEVFRSTRAAAPVPEMKMAGGRKHATHIVGRKASAWQFWCSPSMLM